MIFGKYFLIKSIYFWQRIHKDNIVVLGLNLNKKKPQEFTRGSLKYKRLSELHVLKDRMHQTLFVVDTFF
jgi:hypothetical protein